ncbi:MAG TPA: hypothetical protein DC049_11720 [Spirochaetia bacterium]|nr:hypothetical protein [Spirochaetia bacterium]
MVSEIHNYGWDNRTTKITADGKTYDYEYDVLGRRVKKSLTMGTELTEEKSLLFDGDNAYQEYSAQNVVASEYIFSERIDEPLLMKKNNEEYTYHQDHLGTVMGISGTDGSIANEYGYTAYGVDRVSVENVNQPYKYTGREAIGNTGLYYYRSRVMDANRGRFVREDDWFKEPVKKYKIKIENGVNIFTIFFEINTGEIKWYTYCKNNPIIFSDSFGFDVKNNTDETIYVLPENGGKPVPVEPGGTYEGGVDAVSVPNGNGGQDVYKVTDPFSDSNLEVNIGDLDFPGPDIITETINEVGGGGELDPGNHDPYFDNIIKVSSGDPTYIIEINYLFY